MLESKEYYQAFGSLLGVSLALKDGSYRNDTMTDELNGYIIDTVCTPDCGWETGIALTTNPDHWQIVKRYSDKNDAIKGHNYYKKIVFEKNFNLKNLSSLGWGEI